MIGFMFLGLVAVWVLLTSLIWRLWSRSRKKSEGKWNFSSIAFTAIALLWVAGSLWYGGGRKLYYDAEVRRLCAIDGGVKVYETVTLPPEKFDKWGVLTFYDPTQGENTLGPEYIYKWERIYLRKGEPNITRFHSEVIRRSDRKKLGETTGYSRGGGDLPLPGQPSSYSCPPNHEANEVILLKQIFINSMQERTTP